MRNAREISRLPTEERFMSRVRKEPSGCWVWTACLRAGYGQCCIGKKRYQAHRVAYQMFRGPVPVDMVLDHLCRVRACVNPGHLEIVTSLENVMRGISPSAACARKTHCPKGHELSGANLFVYVAPGKRPARQCRTCRRAMKRTPKILEAQRRWRRARKEKQQAIGPRGAGKGPTDAK